MTARIANDIDTTIGRTIAEARSRQGISQTQLARMIGEHQTTISRVEAGLQPPRYSWIVMILDVLHIQFSVPRCAVCLDAPPDGFTCNACGTGSTP